MIMENETKPFDDIIPDELIKTLTVKVTEKISKDVVSQIDSAARDTIDCWLDEYVKNFEDEMFNRVFKFINGDRWSKFKDKYNAADLRALIYKEHKDELDKMITDQVVEENIHRYLGHFFADSHKTGWQYKPMEALLYKWMIARYPDSEQLRAIITDEAVKENVRLKDEVRRLKERLDEIGNLV